MSDKTVVHNHGISFAGWLGLIFITLKLCGIISWPWALVLAPFWAVLAVVFLLCVVMPLVLLSVAAAIGILAWIIGLFCKRK
jgi:hypothetical protein